MIVTRGGVELAIEIEFDQLFEAAEEEEMRMENSNGGNSEVQRGEERIAMKRERARCFYENE